MVVNSSGGCSGVGSGSRGAPTELWGGTSFQFVFIYAAYLLALAPEHHNLLLQSTDCYQI